MGAETIKNKKIINEAMVFLIMANKRKILALL